MNQTSNRVATGCAVLFLLPFAAAGSVTALRAVQMARLGNWHDCLLFAVFALVFGGVGFGGLAGLRIAYRKQKHQEALQAAHPDEPWLWRSNWASGRIEDSSQEEMLGAWIFAVFWNLVSIPSAYFGVRAALAEKKLAALVVLLFPIAGIWLLVRAVRATLRKEKYGISRLSLSTLPGVVGHTLAGTVRTSMVAPPAGGFQVALTCVRIVTRRSGEDSSATETILWQDQRQTAGEQSRDFSGMGTNIPVSFRLPANAEPCDASDPNNRVIWRLEVTATVPGVDYDSTFEVPVFRTPASSEPATNEEARRDVESTPFRQPLDSRIAVTTNRRGTEILFPAARNPGPATGLTVFTAIWWAALGVQLYFKAPIFFPIVTALFGVLLTVGMLDLWLKVSRVTVSGGTVAVAGGYLQPGREQRLTAAEVSDVVPMIGMQAGKTAYYDVKILRTNGKKMTAGRSIRDQREAEWLAATIKRALAG